MNPDRQTAEFTNLRLEIVERAKLLHQTINLAVILSVVLLVSGFFLQSFLTPEQFTWYLAFTPLVFALLTFNYQSNQMTLEAVAAYVNAGKSSDEWDDAYIKHKRRVVLTSFLKVWPLLIPQLLPLVLLVYGYPLTTGQTHLLILDIVFLALGLINFYYKRLR